MRDLYKILGVDRGADDSTIAKAYKALAKRLHPDVNPPANNGAAVEGATASDELRDVIEAYQVLSKPDERAAYDTALGRSNAEMRGRILVAAVLVMAGSVTMASLATAYYWRAELLAERIDGTGPPTLEAQIAATFPAIAQPARLPSRLVEIQSIQQPLESVATNERVRSPVPPQAPSPTVAEVDTIAGPLRIARAQPAVSGGKAGEVTRFADIKTTDGNAQYGPQLEVFAPAITPQTVPGEVNAQTAVKDDKTEPFPLPTRPPPGPRGTENLVFTKQLAAKLIETRYLSSRRRDRRSLINLYCFRVDYWGERATSRTAVVNQIHRFADRWPRRAYKLQPGSLRVAPLAQPDSYEAAFKYDFSVASAQGFSGAVGVASGRLVIERQHGRWRICAESGRVLRRKAPHSVMLRKYKSKYAGRQQMDTHRILFGE